MRLLEATIYGFGNWVDESFTFSPDALTCIYGENETGKTTLYRFVLFMLFGLPPRHRAFYYPKTSSRMGGRLEVVDDVTGAFTIERLDGMRNGSAVCIMPDGSRHDEDFLQSHLYGMTYGTYESIFSFSAMDLFGMESIKEADLGEIILNIGLTGASNIRFIEKKLDQKLGDLFKPNGKNPAINKQLEKLERLQQERNSHKNEEANYLSKQSDKALLTDRLHNLEEKQAYVKQAFRTLERKLDAWPLIEEYRACRDALKQYPDVVAFPENGLERLNYWNEKMLPLKSEWQFQQANQEQYTEKMEEWRHELYTSSIHEEGRKLLDCKEKDAEHVRHHRQLEERIDKNRKWLKREMDEWSTWMDENELLKLSIPSYLENTWSSLQEMKLDIQRNDEHLRQEKETIDRNRANMQEKYNALMEDMPAEDDISIQRRILTQYDRQSLDASQQMKSDEKSVKMEHIRRKKNRRSKILFALGAGVGSILLVLGVTGVYAPYTISGAVIFLLAGIMQLLLQKHSVKLIDTLIGEMQGKNERLISEDEKKQAEALLRDVEEKQREIAAYTEQLKTWETALIQWEEKVKTNREKDNRFTGKLEEQYTHYPFLRELDISQWQAFYHRLRNWKTYSAQIAQDLQVAEKLEKEQTDLSERMDVFLRQTGADPRHMDREGKWLYVEEIMEHKRRTEEYIRQYEGWKQETDKQIRLLEEQLKTYETEKQGLLDIANVDSEEMFHKRANELDAKEKWDSRMQEVKRRLHHTLGSEVAEEMMEDDHVDRATLHDAWEEKKEMLQELEDDIQDKVEKRADINADIASMETSEAASLAEHRFQMEKEKLQELTQEWGIFKTARSILSETKRNYRQKYMAKVIYQTSIYFSFLTEERYVRIHPPGDETLFRVESPEGLQYSVEELSKGTVDQLYISLRLAISDIMARENALPFMIDDAFVHFDAIRTEKMLEVLARIAEHQQVILFTNDFSIYEKNNHAQKITLDNQVRVHEQ